MVFSKKEIANFKGEGKYYIIEGSNVRRTLKRFRECFYIPNDVNIEEGLKERFSDKNIECCDFNVVWGDYKIGFRYIENEETHYIFLGGSCFYELPEMIAIGKEVDGDIHLICEQFPSNKRYVRFMIISKNEDTIEEKYKHVIFASASKYEKIIKDIKTEDVKCLAKAYRSIKVFSKLVNETINKNKKAK